MVAGYAHDLLAGKSRQLLLGDGVLIGVAIVGDIARDDNEVGHGGVDLGDRGAKQLLPIAGSADMYVREVRDQHHDSLTCIGRWSSNLV